MIRLDATTKKLQVVLAGAVTTSQLEVVSSYSDATATGYTGGNTPTLTNDTTDVDIVAAPAASTIRDVDHISVHNKDTVSATVTIKMDVSGTDYILKKAVLLTGESLNYSHGTGWQTFDVNGALKQASSFVNTNIADTRVAYSSSGSLVGAANMVFDGTKLTVAQLGAFTLTGTIAGGGNQLNNVIIGTSTPLAGAFTSLSTTTTLTVGTGATITDGGLTVTAGNVGVGGTANAAIGVNVTPTALTGATQHGVVSQGTASSAATTAVNGYQSSMSSAAGSYTIPEMRGYYAVAGTKGAGSAWTAWTGFLADTGAEALVTTTAYGFRGKLASGTGIWNLYMGGTANNHFAGTCYFGIASDPSVSGSAGLSIWRQSDHGRIDIGKDTSGAKTVEAFYYAGAAQGSIVLNDASVAYNTSSDKDLKDHIMVATSTDVLRLTVVNDFYWKANGQKARGVYAQDAYLVFADAVTVGDCSINTDGNKKNPWSVDYSKYVPDLIVGWQDHDAKMNDLLAWKEKAEAAMKANLWKL